MKVSIGKYPKYGKRKVSIKFNKEDFWGLDYTLALIILPALKEFRKIGVGYPGCMDYTEDGTPIKGNRLKGQKRWYKILDAMIWSFEQYTKDGDDYNHPLYKKDRDAYWTKKQEGLKLFAEYYGALWY